MSATAASAEHLDGLLRQAVREASLLESTLERESAALGERDMDALNLAVAEKHQLVQSLERITREQTRVLQTAGLEADGPGMERFLRDWDIERQIRPVWNRLQEVMSRCRRLNQINGGVVDLHRRQTEQAIHVLRGEDGRTELYDPSGHTVTTGPSRHFTKA